MCVYYVCNMSFSSFLLEIGEGKIDSFVIPIKWATGDVCRKIYVDINVCHNTDRVILCPHNEEIVNINNNVLNLLYSEGHTYFSYDYAIHKGVD